MENVQLADNGATTQGVSVVYRSRRQRKDYAATTKKMTLKRKEALEAILKLIKSRDPQDLDIKILEDDQSFLIRCLQKKLCQALGLGYNSGTGSIMNWLEKMGYITQGVRRSCTFHAQKAEADLAMPELFPQSNQDPNPTPRRKPKKGSSRSLSPKLLSHPETPPMQEQKQHADVQRMVYLLLIGLDAKRTLLIEQMDADIKMIEQQYGEFLSTMDVTTLENLRIR